MECDIERSKMRLDRKAQVLDGIIQQIQETITESDRHINAFNKFSTIIMERLVADVHAVKDILAELQKKECAKVIIKKTVRIFLYNHRGILMVIAPWRNFHIVSLFENVHKPQ